MFNVGDHIRERASGRTGKILRLFDIDNQGTLAVIRLDHEDPLYGNVTCDWTGELEPIDQAEEAKP